MDFNRGTADKMMDFVHGFTLDFSLANGMSSSAKSSKRFLSGTKEMYQDVAAAEQQIKTFGDRLVYEFYELPAPNSAGDLNFGTSIVYPGKVGEEYHMTKGHFHNVLDTGEVYYCLAGHGYMMMENPKGDWSCMELLPGVAIYCPPCYAHRSINVSPDETLRTFFVYRADAGHDYGTIESKGFRNLLVEKDGQPQTIANPKWKQSS